MEYTGHTEETADTEEEVTRRWYERGLGWPTARGRPLELVTGVRFDVLDVPAAAGLAVLRRFPATGPVARDGERVLLLVAAGGAEELPGLLDWLDWAGVGLDLAARGADGRLRAPRIPGRRPARAAGGSGWGDGTRPVWLRPPRPGREVEPTLPSPAVARTAAPMRAAVPGSAAPGAAAQAAAAPGGRGAAGPVGLAPLVAAVATECHRTRLFPARPPAASRTCQACAFS